MNYRKDFSKYLRDLGRRIPAPGGGSAVCLSFCLGLSLIEKALRYSLPKDKETRDLDKLAALRKKVFVYIDLDAHLFEKAMKAKGRVRELFLQKSEAMVVDAGNCCWELFLLAKKIESGIKKGIASDFYIGLELAKICFKGCAANLSANSRLFGVENKYLSVFNQRLKKWQ